MTGFLSVIEHRRHRLRRSQSDQVWASEASLPEFNYAIRLSKPAHAEEEEDAPPHQNQPKEREPKTLLDKARAAQAVNAGRMSRSEQGKIDRKADAVLNKP